MQLLAESLTPPFPLDEEIELDEMLRLRHRTLDLRRRSMVEAMVLRHDVVQTIRAASTPRTSSRSRRRS